MEKILFASIFLNIFLGLIMRLEVKDRRLYQNLWYQANSWDDWVDGDKEKPEQENKPKLKLVKK